MIRYVCVHGGFFTFLRLLPVPMSKHGFTTHMQQGEDPMLCACAKKLRVHMHAQRIRPHTHTRPRVLQAAASSHHHTGLGLGLQPGLVHMYVRKCSRAVTAGSPVAASGGG